MSAGMIDYAQAHRRAVEALAAEAGCTPDELLAPGVRLYERPDERGPRPRDARRFPPCHPSFSAVGLGDVVAISASRELLPSLRPLFEGVERDGVFEVERLAAVSRLLLRAALGLAGPGLRLLCGEDTLRPRPMPADCELVLEPDPPIERVRELGGGAWPNALDRHQLAGELPTTALAVAYRDARIVGVAAATAEAARLRQIGIDVADGERGRGLGAALTAALARHVLDTGRVPWYAVAPANLASLNTALAAGFRPAWLEVRTVPVRAPASAPAP